MLVFLALLLTIKIVLKNALKIMIVIIKDVISKDYRSDQKRPNRKRVARA